MGSGFASRSDGRPDPLLKAPRRQGPRQGQDAVLPLPARKARTAKDISYHHYLFPIPNAYSPLPNTYCLQPFLACQNRGRPLMSGRPADSA